MRGWRLGKAPVRMRLAFRAMAICVMVGAWACCMRPSRTLAQSLVDAYPGISFSTPVDFEAATDGSNRVFVAELGGRIKVFDNDSGVASTKTFLDVSSEVVTGFELGFLGIALHPDFASNGYVFAHYTVEPQTAIIARFTANASDPDTVVAGSRVIFLEQVQPYGNHNGGKIQFGPDGYLYIGFGDGGSSHDPSNNGQNLGTMLGAILRIDVDGGGSAPDCGSAGTTAYTIPANPFADGPGGACDEIWAYGFRNPWRFSFDGEGTLWVGDVGQNCREEIDRVHGGKNYGWDVMEGKLCHPDFVDCSLTPPEDCSTDGLELPIIDYDRNSTTGGRSVTGGFVYRGQACAPFLTGAYVYGDYITDNVWAMAFDGDSLVSNRRLFDSGVDVVSFGEDASGELYVVDAGGSIFRFDCTALESVDVAYEQGWQQISVPVETVSMKVSDVLSSAELGAPVFEFEAGRFAATDWIVPGRAYLAYFADADTVTYAGVAVDPRTVDVLEGWNLMGPFESDVSTGAVTGSGTTITSPFFELSAGYSSVSVLESGRGYWVAVDSDGFLQIP